MQNETEVLLQTFIHLIFTYQLFLLYEFDVGQNLSGELNGLIEAVFSSVRDVDQLQHFRLQPLQPIKYNQLTLERQPITKNLPFVQVQW